MNLQHSNIATSFFKVLFPSLIYFKREGKERRGEKHQCVVASHAPPTGDLAHNPDKCPDWESNRQTGDPLVPRPMLNPLSYTSQGT